MTDFLAALLDRSLDQTRVLQRRRPSRFEVMPVARDVAAGIVASDDEVPGSRQRTASSQPAGLVDGGQAADLAWPSIDGWDVASDRGQRLQGGQAAATTATGDEVSTRSERGQDRGSGDSGVDHELARLAAVVAQLARQDRGAAVLPPAESSRTRSAAPTQAIIPMVHGKTPNGPLGDRQAGPASPALQTRAAVADITPAGPATGRPQETAPNARNAMVIRSSFPASVSLPPAGRKASPGAEPPKSAKPVVQPLLPPLPPAVNVANASTRANSRRAGLATATTMPATVHVSIGRIEIRATPAPARIARSTSPAAPRLSLDDYLKARDGGRR